MDATEGKALLTCPKCGVGLCLEDVAAARCVSPLGLVADPETDEVFAFFNHLCPSCRTTFVVPAERLRPLLREEPPAKHLNGTAACSGYCTRLDDIAACDQPCAFSPYRRLMIALRSACAAAQPGRPAECDQCRVTCGLPGRSAA